MITSFLLCLLMFRVVPFTYIKSTLFTTLQAQFSAFGAFTAWCNRQRCPLPQHCRRPKGDPLATWPSAPSPQPASLTKCLCPTGCLAKAWYPSVTTSAGTSSGESWTWPSAAGERGPPGSVGAGWAGRCWAVLGGAGLLGCWAAGQGEGEGLIQAEGTEGGGRPVGREAERGPCWFADIRVVTRTSRRVGVPVCQELPQRRPHHSHLGFLSYIIKG